MEYEPVIGLEIHVQLNTKSKLFCGCSADYFGREPNSQVCPICLGLPGAIPSPSNIEAIRKALLIAKALGCRLAKDCYFERKCYFYPDLPKGFQISQHRTAIGLDGEFSVQGGQGGVRIRRVHLEEDAAKLVHESNQTLIDFNRAGVPLVEIVTEPELKEPFRVKDFLKGLRTLFRHLKVSDVDMEKGSMRLEANISMRKKGTAELPEYRVELKNINSFNFLVRALEEEIKRQGSLLRQGKEIIQETRGYNEKTGKTYSQRRKEDAADYRYFPEPDLPPITAEVLTCEAKVVLPKDLRKQFEKKYDLPRNYVQVLLSDPDLVALFEAVVGKVGEVSQQEVANAIVNHRFGDPRKLGVQGLVRAVRGREKGKQLSEVRIEEHVDKIITDNPHAVSDYRAGKGAALQFLLGALMKTTKGKVDPNKARELLKKRLMERPRSER